MDDLQRRLENLPVEKRALLEKLLINKKPDSPVKDKIPSRELANFYPLSFPQKRMWMLQELNPASANLNIALSLKLTGRVDHEALKYSLNEMISRHDSFRTIIKIIDNEPVQIVLDKLDLPFQIIDFSGSSDNSGDVEIRVKDFIEQESRQPFNLGNPPLLRLFLLQISDFDSYLFMLLHHSIADGWSMNVFLNEFKVLYRSYVLKIPADLPPLQIQYKDFACWQSEKWNDPDNVEKLKYWKNKLKDYPPSLELPTDYPRPLNWQFQSDVYPFTFPDKLTNQIRSLSKQEGVTLFMVLLAAYQALLSVYSGQDDILVGTPVSGRDRSEVENLIGVFINNLVIRTDLSGNPSFRELLRRVRVNTIEAFDHQDVPFEKILDLFHPDRSPGYTPLFQVYFNLLPKQLDQFDLLGLTVELQAPIETGANFDLSLYCDDQDQHLAFYFVYNADLFDPSSIHQMADYFQAFVERIVADPNQEILHLRLLNEDDHRKRNEIQNPVHPRPEFNEFRSEGSETISSRFEKQAKLFTANIAVRSNRFEWSYGQLAEQVDRTAAFISERLSPTYHQVALLFEHDALMIVGILSVLKTGNAYIPLDPALPNDRLVEILNDSQAVVVLTDSKNFFRAKNLTQSQQVINIDRLDAPAGFFKNNEAVCHPESIAYILYTSGTTGKPKGVVQSQRNVLGHIQNYTNNLKINPKDRLSLFSSYSFDAAVMDIFGALLNGATLCLFDVKNDSFFDIPQWMVDQCITIYHSTPSLFRYLMGSLPPNIEFTDIRLVVLGGEEAFKSDVDLYQANFSPTCVLINGLGPTECTIALQNFISHDSAINRNRLSVGAPVQGTQIYFLDREKHPVEIFGEIAIKSPNIALGYWQQPELTEKSFIRNPLDDKSILYCTGDYGRLLPDGSIEYIGRKDAQVKIHGYRVELTAIESTIMGLGQIKQAVVLAREKPNIEKQLVCYYKPDPTLAPSPKQIADYLRSKLPNYMVPSLFIPVDAIPLLPNGKVDRKALLNIEAVHESEATQTSMPQTSEAMVLLDIWKAILGRDEIGIQDDFFALGGHSLIGVKMIAEIEQKFSVKLPLSALFQYPTLQSMANAIHDQIASQNLPAHKSPLVAIQPLGTKPPFYCVHPRGGGVLGYHSLAYYLGNDQPFFGLEARPEDARDPYLDSIETIAAYYIRAIQEFQPRGPYYLGGYSFGGMISYEMACQLRSQGNEVRFLAMLDCPAPKSKYDQPSFSLQFFKGFIKNFPFWWKDFWQITKKERTGRIHRKLRPYEDSVETANLDLRNYIDDLDQIPGEYQELIRKHYLAYYSYQPKTFPGRVTVFRTDRQPLICSFDPHLEWDSLALGGVDIYRIEGAHRNILQEPNVISLAGAMKQAFEQIRASSDFKA